MTFDGADRVGADLVDPAAAAGPELVAPGEPLDLAGGCQLAETKARTVAKHREFPTSPRPRRRTTRRGRPPRGAHLDRFQVQQIKQPVLELPDVEFLMAHAAPGRG